MLALLARLPKNYLSEIAGWLAHRPLPQPIATWLIRWFVRRYLVDTSQLTRPIESYRSLGEFFVRDLVPSARPVSGEIVSPVDGLLRHVEHVKDESLTQVKGISYSLADLLGDSSISTRFEGGGSFNYYLSPKDYHHVHMPTSGRVTQMIHIPGALWPVNREALHGVPGLFAVNERVVILCDTSHGPMALVMVGAYNVGSIEVTFDSIVTNRGANQPKDVRFYPEPKVIPIGGRVGTFRLGSSVVLVFGPGFNDLLTPLPSVHEEIEVRFGEKILAHR